MHCTDEEFIAYLDGEADAQTEAYVAQYAHCAASVAEYEALQQDMLRALFRRHCPSSQTLSDYRLGLLSEVKDISILLHLAKCVHCKAELDELGEFLQG